MAINKVVTSSGETIIDLSTDNLTESNTHLVSTYTDGGESTVYHANSGVRVSGTAEDAPRSYYTRDESDTRFAHRYLTVNDQPIVVDDVSEPRTEKITLKLGDIKDENNKTVSSWDSKQDKAPAQTTTIAVADWSGGTTCTKSVTDVTANSIVIVDTSDGSVQCTAQGEGTLTFTAPTTPTESVIVKVVIL